MKKLLLITTFLILIFIPGLIAEDLPLLAVPSIAAVEVPESLASTCRNMVETALIKTGKFMVLSYTDMEEILDAQAFSLSGCTDESCAIEIGELLAADNIVVGDLSEVGDGMVLSIRLVNVTSGHTVSGEVMTITDLAEMQELVFKASYALAGMKYTGGTSVIETGSIYVAAADDKVLEVYLDGKSHGFTPVLVEDVPFGVHVLEAKSNDYLYTSEVSIATKDILEIVADVSLLKGNLFLTVLPPSATGYEIIIDGELGKTGLNRNLPVGKLQVEIAGNGWYFTGEVPVETGKTTRYSSELIEAGSVQFFGPEGIKVEIRISGETMFIRDVSQPNFLPTGSYEYIISHDDYETIEGRFELGAASVGKIEPSYEYSEIWVIKQRIIELEEKKSKAIKSRKFTIPAAWALTGIGGAGLGFGGIMEAAIQYKGNTLADIHLSYLSSTNVEELRTLGEEMNTLKDGIPGYRVVRNYSLIGGGSTLLFGGLMFLLSPNIQSIDTEIEELQGRLK